ncbi:MAG TPA: hypothetical protein VMQ52_05295 [Candidatus Saccharimonadales bacterium]|nr:MAG: capsid protein [Cressdnaviricota sp.]HUD08468.1 hypothetical protein [Candidatus Saccharimonadales bacterium]
MAFYRKRNYARRFKKRYKYPVKRYIHRRFKRYQKRGIFARELKYLDNLHTGAGGLGNGPANWSQYYLTGVQQGLNVFNRTGDSVNGRSINITFELRRNQAGGPVQRCRCMVICYPQAAGAQPTGGDIFQYGSQFQGPRNLLWQGFFKILADKTVTLDVAKSNMRTIKIKRKLKGRRMTYLANGGVYGDQMFNSVFLVVWSDQTANQPTIDNVAHRFYYTDM